MAARFQGLFQDCEAGRSLMLDAYRHARTRYNRAYDVFFRNHDPIAIDEHYAHFQRAIRRFLNILESKEFVVLLRGAERYERDKAEVTYATNVIKRAFPNSNFVILVPEVTAVS